MAEEKKRNHRNKGKNHNAQVRQREDKRQEEILAYGDDVIIKLPNGALDVQGKEQKHPTVMERLLEVLECVRMMGASWRVAMSQLRFFLSLKKTRFPVVMPSLLNDDNKIDLTYTRYNVAYKLDGTRYLLFVKADGVFLVGRNLNVYRLPTDKVPLVIDLGEWKGTILDGELIEERDENHDNLISFVVLDVLSVKDLLKVKSHLVYRLNAACSFVDLWQSANKRVEKVEEKVKTETGFDFGPPRLNLRFQQYYAISQIRMLMACIHGLFFKADGFIFVPTEKPYRMGWDRETFKWKSQMNQTADFVVHELSVFERNYERTGGDEVMELHIMGNKTEQLFDYCSDPIFRQHMGAVVECIWDDEAFVTFPNGHEREGAWRFLRLRSDKSQANHISTIREMEQARKFPLSEEKLIQFVESLKDRTARVLPEYPDFEVSEDLVQKISDQVKSATQEEIMLVLRELEGDVTETIITLKQKVLNQKKEKPVIVATLGLLDEFSIRREERKVPHAEYDEEEDQAFDDLN